MSVDSLSLRPLDPAQLKGARRRSLYRLQWQPCPSPERSAPESELWRWAPGGEEESPAASTLAALAAIQAHLAEDSPTRLAVLTQGAISTGGEPAEPAAQAIWGLLRSAISEHPDRFMVIDSDGTQASEEALPSALASEEPQLALREGKLLIPRLTQVEETPAETQAARFDPERTVLITGATGGLGSLIAPHLVKAHGARQLLLVSRRGEEAPGAPELKAELEQLGATVQITACDVSDARELKGLLGSLPASHPLGAVIHTAGVIDDGVIDSLDGERLQAVFAAKADAARHLHELTRESELSHFVLFSSIAATLGFGGQGNYAAANAYLDALAQKRAAEGLPASSLAWGAWQRASGMTEGLAATDLARFSRLGLAPIADEQGLELFDLALCLGEPALAPVAFDNAALRAQAKAGTLAPLLRGLVRTPARAAGPEGEELKKRLAGAPAVEHEAIALGFVREHVAAVLGHASAAEIEPERAFGELGFDSLAAVELRNRLAAATGLRLAPALVFDHPNALAVSAYLLEQLDPAGAGEGEGSLEQRVREALESIPLARLEDAGLLQALLALADANGGGHPEQIDTIAEIDTMDIDDLVRRTIDRQAAGSEIGGEG